MPKLLHPIVKNELIWQIKDGRSINKISTALGVGKSTIYYHYKKLLGRKYLQPHFEPKASEEEGEICGIFAGDGSQYFEPKKYSYEVNVHFGNHARKYAEYVQALFEKFFNKSFRLRDEKSGVLRLQTQSKIIYQYFKNYLEYDSRIKHCTVRLKTIKLPMEFKTGFLRGFFDTDGCLYYDKANNRFRAIYFTTSKKLALQIQLLLSEKDIVASIYVYRRKVWKTIYRVSILQRGIDTFLKTIQPFKARKFKGR